MAAFTLAEDAAYLLRAFMAGGEIAEEKFAGTRAANALARITATSGSASIGGSLIFGAMERFLGKRTRSAMANDDKPNPGPPSKRRPIMLQEDNPTIHEYSGFAVPVRGPLDKRHFLGIGLPMHFDKSQRLVHTRAILRQFANERVAMEIDAPIRRGVKRRRPYHDTRSWSHVKRRLDLQGLTDFALEARRVWDDVQQFLPRH